MNLIIDVGNTRIKIAVFKQSEIIHTESIINENFLSIVFETIEKFNIKYGIISSVAFINNNDFLKIQERITLIELDYSTKVPFKNDYSTPKTLGVDRIALVSAAIAKFPKKNVLIIDAGTCITYDFLSKNGIYFGGAISPGLKMRYNSLNYFTKKLPQLSYKEVDLLIGNSTNESIHIGVVGGILNEIDGFINLYKEKNKELTVVLTGGDVNFLANRLKNGIFANPNFLLEGLNNILIHNLK
ncbi:type III pantothenate kinase [Lutibacter sp.]|uniref:type III pantothenate kinase n=1 Tax=Lutibacter sp. TaxID=1925666 RepID=UPI0027338D37|nr:type III pantothenate kinase [Lutibacter sp.]MDP3312252.1 type III pantothenate kinase [Lutibacter sp.]